MNEVVVLTPERILEATEEVLRRYGLAKATVVDVARALDVSHGSVYRHFPSKASLREAVARRWLDRANAPLQKVAESTGPAPDGEEAYRRPPAAVNGALAEHHGWPLSMHAPIASGWRKKEVRPPAPPSQAGAKGGLTVGELDWQRT